MKRLAQRLDRIETYLLAWESPAVEFTVGERVQGIRSILTRYHVDDPYSELAGQSYLDAIGELIVGFGRLPGPGPGRHRLFVGQDKARPRGCKA